MTNDIGRILSRPFFGCYFDHVHPYISVKVSNKWKNTHTFDAVFECTCLFGIFFVFLDSTFTSHYRKKSMDRFQVGTK